MKTTVVLLLMLALASPARSQVESLSLKGRHEVSPAFIFQYMKEKEWEGSWWISIPLRWTYFVNDNLALGAEFMGTFYSEGIDPGLVFSGIMEYNFTMPKAFPFLSLGTGISNGSYLMDRMAFKNYDKALGVITVGGGFKIPVNERLLFRMDVQYRQYRGKTTEFDYYTETDTDVKIRTGSVLTAFGISVLL